MKLVEFDFQAELEILDILAWYEKYPALGSPFQDVFHRVILKNSPYYLIYREYETFSKVYAVMHGRRKPGYWAERLKNGRK